MSNTAKAKTLAGLFLICLVLIGLAYEAGASPIFALLTLPVMVLLFSATVILGNKN